MSSDGLDRLDVPHRRLVAFHKTAAARDSAIRESLNLLSTFILFALVLAEPPRSVRGNAPAPHMASHRPLFKPSSQRRGACGYIGLSNTAGRNVGHWFLLAMEVDRQAGSSSLEEHMGNLSCTTQSTTVVVGREGV